MPTEQTAVSEAERNAIERVARERGVTFEEAAEQLAKEGLASRVRRRTGKAPARVYQMPARRNV